MRTILINSADKVHILIRKLTAGTPVLKTFSSYITPHHISSFQVTFKLPVGKAVPGGHPEKEQLCFTTRTSITRKIKAKQ